VIPAAPLEWFDQASQGIVLLFGDDGRHETRAWLQERCGERGNRLVCPESGDAASTLRHARRWDIDSLFFDDCADGDTMMAALEVAEEGALVVLTSHTTDVVTGMQYLRSLLEPGTSGRGLGLLSRQLRLAISQRSVERADGQGKVASFEVLEVTPAQRNFIRSDMIHQLPAQMAVARGPGARWWPDALADLVLAGTSTLEAAEAAGHEPGEVERALGRAEGSAGRRSGGVTLGPGAG